MNKTPNYQLNQWEAEDRVLRTDFNADNAKIDAALGTKVSVVTGAYTGDRRESRVIDLGCQPKAVLLMRYDGETHFNGYIFGGLILPGHPLGGSEAVAEIVSNGFQVSYKGNVSNASNTNTNTDYVYIAFV